MASAQREKDHCAVAVSSILQQKQYHYFIKWDPDAPLMNHMHHFVLSNFVLGECSILPIHARQQNGIKWHQRFSISPSDDPTTHSNGRGTGHEHGCNNAALHFESRLWNEQHLFSPLAPHAALLEFCSAFLRTSLWISHVSHTSPHIKASQASSRRPITHLTHTENDLSPGRSQWVILNIQFHQTLIGCCYTMRHDELSVARLLAKLFWSKHEVQHNYRRCNCG